MISAWNMILLMNLHLLDAIFQDLLPHDVEWLHRNLGSRYNLFVFNVLAMETCEGAQKFILRKIEEEK